jgi:hypothetical protein
MLNEGGELSGWSTASAADMSDVEETVRCGRPAQGT